jgi:hypothetical protein
MENERTLLVPNSLGSSRSVKAPAPMLGKLDERTTSFPPIGTYRPSFSIATRESDFQEHTINWKPACSAGPIADPVPDA